MPRTYPGEHRQLDRSRWLQIGQHVDHLSRRTGDGELASELPPAVDQALVAAGLKAKLGPWTLATVRHRVAVLSTAH